MQIADKKDLDVYSTSEQVVGTWIDGKPIYRRSFVTTINRTTTSQQDVRLADTTDWDIDNYISLGGMIKSNNLDWFASIPYAYSTATQTIGLYTATTHITIGLYGIAVATYTIYWSVCYTKTTD